MGEKRVGVRNAGAFLGDNIMAAGTPAYALNVGPGEPGPGDEWVFPTEPVETQADVTLEPVHSDGKAVSSPKPTPRR